MRQETKISSPGHLLGKTPPALERLEAKQVTNKTIGARENLTFYNRADPPEYLVIKYNVQKGKQKYSPSV